jgi:cation:H+ antiporter
MDILMILGGLVLLFLGGESLVRGAVAIARSLGLSALLIGLTIVGFGTSTPELLVSVQAALGGSSAIALGNVVGSNIANILVILALSALITPMTKWQPSVRRDAIVMVLVAAVLLGLVQFGVLTRLMGFGLVGCLLVYLFVAYRMEKVESDAAVVAHGPHTMHEQETEEMQDVKLAGWKAWAAVALGLVLLMIGANWLVTGAINIARGFGISEAVIGLTIVAVGTSLPELATSVIAALRKHPDVAIGNVVGSNIFNILGILGITAIIRPVEAAPNFQLVDTPIMLAVSVGLMLMLLTFKTIGRLPATIMLGLYVAYTLYLFNSAGGTTAT